jgi:hypothetical protein
MDIVILRLNVTGRVRFYAIATTKLTDKLVIEISCKWLDAWLVGILPPFFTDINPINAAVFTGRI